MTVTDIVLIIGVLTTSIVTVINAVASARRGQMLGHKQDIAMQAAVESKAAVEQVAQVVVAKADLAAQQLEHIETLTNSTLSAALAKIAQLESMLKDVRAELREAKRRAAGA